MSSGGTVDVAAYPPTSIWHLRRVREDPVAFLQRVAADGDVVGFALHRRTAFLLNHPDHIEEVLVLNHGKFAKPSGFARGGLLGSGLLTAEGDLHRSRRRALQPAFSPQRLAAYGTTISRCVAELLDTWQDGQVVDMAAEMHRLAVQIIGRILFGVDLAPQAPDIRRALGTASASLDPLLSLLSPARSLRPARAYLRDLLDRLIDQRWHQADAADDVVSVLRQTEDTDAVVTEQLRDDVLTLFIAGHDTIANALTWTWHLLAGQEAVDTALQRELREVLGGRLPTAEQLPELPFTGRVLAESLRLYPPSWILTRQALEPHIIGGVQIPAGSIVVMSQYLTHRDARFFDEPLAFDPDRWLPARLTATAKRAYFPFGAGPRSCIGQGLAMLEGTLVLAAIASRWRCLQVAPVAMDARATLRPRGQILMELRVRN